MSINLEQALQTNIAERIDAEVVSSILSGPPWVKIHGVYNVRDIGTGSESSTVRKGFAFRSGLMECITERGKQDIQDLRIKKIFDLRSEKEMNEFPDPVIDGVEVVKAAEKATTIPADSGRYSSLPPMYMDMLITHQQAWKMILAHIRDHSDQAFLFHCTGGKDRTGVAAAIILSFASLPAKDISQEYALSRIGVEPAHDLLTQKFTGGRKIDMQNERFQQIAKISADTMEEFLGEVEKVYGSVAEYAMTVLDLSQNDIDVIRQNLIRPKSGRVIDDVAVSAFK